ncbi:MAG TPA: protein-methionine-sulfoxide reductase heme-binding subunit MsrQ [Anaerolineales bacterium]|jgi:sulfoxide reductase heme-binding subunit YedZ
MSAKKPTLLQVIVHVGGWLPLALIVSDYFTHRLTANPIQAIEQRTGIQALTFLLLSLACTPLSSILGWRELTKRRKALGNYGFLYASIHVLTFIGLDYAFNFMSILRDVGTKWYILIGLLAFLLLVPLAFTSFKYWMKRLGKNWKRLHWLAYIISPLVALHFLLSVKGDLTRLQGNILQPLLYGSVALILLILRISTIKVGLMRLRTKLESRLRNMIPSGNPPTKNQAVPIPNREVDHLADRSRFKARDDQHKSRD